MKLSCLYFLLLLPFATADLQVGFYKPTCHRAEAIIQRVVQKHFSTDPSIAAALLRLHFHDCLVRGCDASILIDSTTNTTSEKDGIPNLTVRGYEIIDDIKSVLEARCPSTVSCADVITLATRDAVALAGGPRYIVPTGRRDGLVSTREETRNLPGPSSSVPHALQSFVEKGLTLEDMVVLLGAHTIGVAHCGFFRSRLFNFQGSGAPDPSMDPDLRTKLAGLCGNQSRPFDQDPTTFLDQDTSFTVDSSFYRQVIAHKGILQIDQELGLDNSTSSLVATLGSDETKFRVAFRKAMVKLASIEVLTGTDGEIRKNCRTIN